MVPAYFPPSLACPIECRSVVINLALLALLHWVRAGIYNPHLLYLYHFLN